MEERELHEVYCNTCERDISNAHGLEMCKIIAREHDEDNHNSKRCTTISKAVLMD